MSLAPPDNVDRQAPRSPSPLLPGNGPTSGRDDDQHLEHVRAPPRPSWRVPAQHQEAVQPLAPGDASVRSHQPRGTPDLDEHEIKGRQKDRDHDSGTG